jgi:hypothetical protein
MKKYLIFTASLLCFIYGPKPAYADTVPAQILPSLLQHVVPVTEFTTEGITKIEFLDGLIQFGHYSNDYIAAIDAGFCNNTIPDANGRLALTAGVHVHVISFVNSYFNINPALALTLQQLELTPRVSYDGDVHAWVYGATFGVRIPFN